MNPARELKKIAAVLGRFEKKSANDSLVGEKVRGKAVLQDGIWYVAVGDVYFKLDPQLRPGDESRDLLAEVLSEDEAGFLKFLSEKKSAVLGRFEKKAASISKAEVAAALKAVEVLSKLGAKLDYNIVYGIADTGEDMHACHAALLAHGLESRIKEGIGVDEIYDEFLTDLGESEEESE